MGVSEALVSMVMVGALLIVSQLSPGPDVFLVFRTALARGFRGGCAVATGINLGFFLQTLVVALAGSWVIQQSWSRWVFVAAGGWLLYLAWHIFPRHWKGACLDKEHHHGAPLRMRQLLVQGFLCNILNPKCTLFIGGLLLGPLHTFGARYIWYTPALLALFLLSSQLGWMLWCALLQWPPVRGYYLRHASLVDAVFAVLLAIVAFLLIFPVGQG